MVKILRRLLLGTVGRAYAGFHEWFTHLPHARYTDEGRASFLVVALLGINTLTILLASRRLVSPRAFGWILAGGPVVPVLASLCLLWGGSWVIRTTCTSAIESLATESVSQRFWRGTAILLYVFGTIIGFGAALFTALR